MLHDPIPLAHSKAIRRQLQFRLTAGAYQRSKEQLHHRKKSSTQPWCTGKITLIVSPRATGFNRLEVR
jgi:hypothetical protein